MQARHWWAECVAAAPYSSMALYCTQTREAGGLGCFRNVRFHHAKHNTQLEDAAKTTTDVSGCCLGDVGGDSHGREADRHAGEHAANEQLNHAFVSAREENEPKTANHGKCRQNDGSLAPKHVEQWRAKDGAHLGARGG